MCLGPVRVGFCTALYSCFMLKKMPAKVTSRFHGPVVLNAHVGIAARLRTSKNSQRRGGHMQMLKSAHLVF